MTPQTQDLQAWRRPFFTIWGAQAVSLLGSSLVQFALVWWLTETTGSATVLATATIAGMLPQILLAPLGGTLVDRWNRRVVMIVADSGIALATVVLAALFALDVVQPWHVYVLMFVRSAGGGFHWPAMQASTSLMVPRDHLSRIQGLNQTLNGLSNIVAPPLGALLLAVLPLQGILAIDVVTAALAVTPLLFIPVPQPRRAPPAEGVLPPSVLADFRAGLDFVRGWLGLMLIIGIAVVLNLLVNPAMSLLPIMVTDHFQGGAPQLALLQAAFGIGMVAGGITLSIWGGFRSRVATGLAAFVLQSFAIVAIGLTPSNLLPLAVGAFFAFGFLNPIGNGSLIAVMQGAIPPEMQGRVLTLVMSLVTAASPLGLAVAGPVADALGVQVWFLIGGLAGILLMGGAFFVPAIMQLEEQAAEMAAALAAASEAAAASAAATITDVGVEPAP
jgi:DHA3 family macrolide efflux protein-like MFS transporter